eukprot:227909-Pleurochrysis_carterae.AAC.1
MRSAPRARASPTGCRSDATRGLSRSRTRSSPNSRLSRRRPPSEIRPACAAPQRAWDGRPRLRSSRCWAWRRSPRARSRCARPAPPRAPRRPCAPSPR